MLNAFHPTEGYPRANSSDVTTTNYINHDAITALVSLVYPFNTYLELVTKTKETVPLKTRCLHSSKCPTTQ